MPRHTTKRVGRKKIVGKKLNKRQVREVKRLVGARTESKYTDIIDGGAPWNPGHVPTRCSWDGNIDCLSQTAQGVGDSAGRIGDTIHVRYVELDFLIALQGTPSSKIRVIMLQWHPNTPGVGVMIPGQILSTLTLGTNYAPYSTYIWDSMPMFTVLFDKSLSIGIEGNNYISRIKTKVFGKRLRKSLQYQSGGANATNHIYLLYVSDVDPTSGNVPYVQYQSRVVYTDA